MMYDVDLGLLVVRVMIGALMFAHGSQKLFGWFNGYGVTGTGGYFDSIGYRAGATMSIIAGAAEAGGGLLLALGLLTPLAVATLAGMMVNVAVAGHGKNGFWNHNQPPGWEFPMVLGVIAATVALAGPGTYSMDRYLGLTTGFEWAGVAALGAGAGAGVLFLAIFRRPMPKSLGKARAEADGAT